MEDPTIRYQDLRRCPYGNESTVTRQAPGIESQIVARRGAVWLSPPGLQDGSVDFAQELPEFLHLYLPLSHFSSGNFDTDTDVSAVGALRYETALEDPLLAEIGCAVVSELKTETSAGSLLVESLAPAYRCKAGAKACQHITRPVFSASQTDRARSTPASSCAGLHRSKPRRRSQHRSHGIDCVPEPIPFRAGLSGRPSGNRRIATSAPSVLSARKRF